MTEVLSRICKFLKKITLCIFWGNVLKNCLFLKFLENSRKNIFRRVFLSSSSYPIYHPQLYSKLIPPQKFPVNVLRIFKIAGTASVLESLFSKKTDEISAFYNSASNSIGCIGILRILRNSVLNGVAVLQSTGCNITKNELLTELLIDVLEVLENFQEELCNVALFK